MLALGLVIAIALAPFVANAFRHGFMLAAFGAFLLARHTFGGELALAGCTDAEGAALMSHASAATFAIYRRQADKLQLSDAGAAKLQSLRQRNGTDVKHTGGN